MLSLLTRLSGVEWSVPCATRNVECPKVVRTCRCSLSVVTWKCVRETACTFTCQLLLRTWCFVTFWLAQCASRHNGVHFLNIWTSKSGPRMSVFNILTWKCASRHNGVHFFDISTSKSAPKLVCFVHFDLEMCFALQRRALFRHLNFQKCSEHGVFCTFWLGNVLRATTACTFSTSQLPKVLRNGVFCTFWLGNVLRATTACTFSTSQLAKSGPRMMCFVAFWLGNVLRASTACNFSSLIWPQNTVFRDFATFSRTCIFFLLTLSLLWSSLFCSSLLWLFPPLLFHRCRKFDF